MSSEEIEGFEFYDSKDFDMPDDLNEINDPDPYDIPEESIETLDSIDDVVEMDDAFETGNLNEVNDPDPYDIPEESIETLDSIDDVVEMDNAFETGNLNEVNDPDSYDIPEESIETLDSIEDVVEMDNAFETGNLNEANDSDSEDISESSNEFAEADSDSYVENENLNEGEIEEDPPKVYTYHRDDRELLDMGQRNIEQLLDVRADDYRDKGYEEGEIQELLKTDRSELQQSFLHDAFPGRNVPSSVFDNPDLLDTANISKTEQDLAEMPNWISDINPNFDPYDIDSPYCNNCGSCAYAVYRRLEGDPSVTATADNIGYNSEMEALTGMEQISMSPDEIRDRLLAAGDGAHAIIGIDRADSCGHWFNAACINGEVYTIDGQSGEISKWPPDYGNVVNWEMSIKK